ncbi:hypothetical protein MVES1_002786 [Malassezia vespertilionis]|uniref:Nam9p n=1 Tax=Malassezia vespertilionis TaxID=2020962 RepID=A0A2N1JAZ4_9BASI|nr:uncharacterized protein MVES1_002786 [Malassezia vespertilionis]PKI83721.1 Nam9p [Malassezia vespertilionis]WFD07422.1 hypothetical protein MVES1_002786 [Malassezia vespertilionis]
MLTPVSSETPPSATTLRMRKANVFRAEAAIPRMSWSPRNLYNLIARSTTPFLAGQTSFAKTSLTMFQQRYRSKRLLRGYHGDWIPETRFKRWFLPTRLPSYAPQLGRDGSEHALDTPVPPIAHLFLGDIERRLDVSVFRCCFAHSAYHGRSLVLHGKVTVNGEVVTDPGALLREGDLISVEPASVPMLNKHVARRVKEDVARRDKGDASVPENTHAEASQVADAPDAPEAPEAPDAAPAPSSFAPQLPNGVLPFHLPPFAAPFLFIPPHLDVSFRTCSAIYMRNPTITTSVKRKHESGTRKPNLQRVYHSDIASPYPPANEMHSLAWEYYVRNAPRVRSGERRTKLTGRYGRNGGFDAARAWERDRRRVAIRRGWGKKRRNAHASPAPI